MIHSLYLEDLELIKRLKESADFHADCMEGADLVVLKIHEGKMMRNLESLKEFYGIIYDPMSGKEIKPSTGNFTS